MKTLECLGIVNMSDIGLVKTLQRTCSFDDAFAASRKNLNSLHTCKCAFRMFFNFA